MRVVSKPSPGSVIVDASGRSNLAIQAFFDDLEESANRTVAPSPLPAFAKANLPSAADNPYGMIYVTDEVGGAVPAFSDGTNWRRATDRAVVS